MSLAVCRALMESDSEIIEGSVARYHLSYASVCQCSEGSPTQLSDTVAVITLEKVIQLLVAPEKVIRLLIYLLG